MVIWGLVALCALMIALALTHWPAWPAEVFLSILPQLGAVTLMLGLMIFGMGRPLIAVGACLLAAIAFWGAREQWLAPAPVLTRHDVRIVWANVFDREDSFARVMRAANSVDADVVVIGELPPRMSAEARVRLRGAYVHEAGRPLGAATNIAVFSRAPLGSVDVAPQDKRPGLMVRIQTPRGDIAIAGVHASVPASARATRQRGDSILGAVGLIQGARVGVLVGDFNTVSWSPLLRGIERGGRARRVSLGRAATWMARWPIFGLPIDHVFVAGSGAAHARLGPAIGSDHFPLIVDVRIAAPASE